MLRIICHSRRFIFRIYFSLFFFSTQSGSRGACGMKKQKKNDIRLKIQQFEDPFMDFTYSF